MFEDDRTYICENCGEDVSKDLPDLLHPYQEIELCEDCRDPENIQHPGELSELTMLRFEEQFGYKQNGDWINGNWDIDDDYYDDGEWDDPEDDEKWECDDEC